MTPLRWWHKVVLFAVFGWAIEVFFTGFFSAIGGDIKATGHTYLWMVAVWGPGGLIFERSVFFLKTRRARFLPRVLVYAIGLMVVEYLAGGLIYLISGIVPWDYSADTDWHISGFVRLDYLPYWAVCGIVMEQFAFFVKRVKLAL